MPRSFLVKKKEKGTEKSCCGFSQVEVTQPEAFDLSVNSTSTDMFDFESKGIQLISTSFGSHELPQYYMYNLMETYSTST